MNNTGYMPAIGLRGLESTFFGFAKNCRASQWLWRIDRPLGHHNLLPTEFAYGSGSSRFSGRNGSLRIHSPKTPIRL